MKNEIHIDPRQLNADLQKLISRVKKLNLKKKKVAIVAIGRGGLVPAQYLAYALGIKDIFCIQSKLYKGKKKTGIHNVSGLYNIPYIEYNYFKI